MRNRSGNGLFLFVALQEKAPYMAKAETRKEEYNKAMTLYNKKLVLFLLF